MAISVISLTDNASLWATGRDQGVEQFRYLTHPELVNEVCVECLYWHDTVWQIGDPSAPDPPLHPLCACTIEPEFDAGYVLGQDPDGNPLIFNPAPELEPGEHLGNVLSALPAAKMDEIIGPSRGALLRSGTLDPEDLVSRSAGIKTVDQLLSAAQISKDELANLTFEQLKRLSEQRLGRERAKARRRRESLPPTQPGDLQAGYFLANS